MNAQPHPPIRRCALALGIALGLGAGAASAIVTANPATAGPPANDPHVAPSGPLDINDHLPPFHPNWPPIDHDGVVELEIERGDASGTTVNYCSGAVITTPPGIDGQTRAVLSAKHCFRSSQIVQVRTTISVAGTPTTYSTCHRLNDANCPLFSGIMFIPGSFGFDAESGNDIALVYFEQPISPAATAYEVVSSSQDDWPFFVKFGFGCHGYGGTGVDINDATNPNVYDRIKRWAANTWDGPGLGAFNIGVCSGKFTHNETHRTYDFDNYTQITNNFFNFYMHIFDPVNGWIEIDNQAYSWGVWGAEGWACNGDSGGPNFVFDDGDQQWKIAGVTSYTHRMTDDVLPAFPGNPDIDGSVAGTVCGKNASFGEFGGDAVVHDGVIDAILQPISSPTQQLPSL